MTPPQPPAGRRTGRTGPIAAIVGGSVVFVLGIFAFTAWVAPGFLLPGSEETDPAAGARASAQRIMTAFADQDQATLRSTTCRGAEPPVEAAIEQAGDVGDATLTGHVVERGGTATASGRITAGHNPIDIEIELARRDGSWCWQAIAVPGVQLHGSR